MDPFSEKRKTYFLWAQTLLLGGWLGRVWARRLIIGQNLTKKEENKNILFPGNIFLPGPPGILLSFLKLQNIFIRIILIRHCLQGICSAGIILARFRADLYYSRSSYKYFSLVRMLFLPSSYF